MATVEALLKEHLRRQRSKAFEKFRPYGWQLKWLNSHKKMVVALCANQVGKSTTIALKASMTARCVYPDYYTGPKIEDRAPVIFVIGLTSEEVRDSIQTKLIGPNVDDPGGGMIPPEDIIKITKRANVPGAADTIFVRHPLGQAQICLKTAEQGRERLQGATVDLVIIDEEPPRDVLNELVARTAKANGQLCIGFTALKGMSEVYIFLTEQEEDVVEIIHASWSKEDSPHLTDESIRLMTKIYSDNPAELQARSTGIPTVGKGQIYPFPQDDYSGRLFKIRPHMRRIIALDPGWTHPTAAVACAYDDDADILYVYDEHRQEAKPPAHHASAIKRWGDIPIVMDTAGLQTNKNDGTTLYGMYEYEFDGPDWEQVEEDKRRIQIADNTAGSVMSGIARTYQMFDEGRLYISENCVKLLAELKLYRYDERTGKIVKKNDDLCLSGGTMLVTPNGPVAIKDISIGDLIATPSGFMPVVSHVNRGKHIVNTYLMSDGTRVTCTPDHEFLACGLGFIPIDTISRCSSMISGGINDKSTNKRPGSYFKDRSGIYGFSLLQVRPVSEQNVRWEYENPAPSGCVGNAQRDDIGFVYVCSPYGREQDEQRYIKLGIDAAGRSYVESHDSRENRHGEEGHTKGPGTGEIMALLGGRGKMAPSACPGVTVKSYEGIRSRVQGVWDKLQSVWSAKGWRDACLQILQRKVQDGSLQEEEIRREYSGSGHGDSGKEELRNVRFRVLDKQAQCFEVLHDSLSTKSCILEEKGEEDVFDISINGTHCFYLDNGLISSNCDALRYAVTSLRLAKIQGMRVRWEDTVYDIDDKWEPIDPIVGY